MERLVLLNVLAKNLPGHPISHKRVSLMSFLDEASLEKLTKNTWTRLWSKFMSFGTVNAGIITILMILKFIKLLIETVIRRYTLHSIYGWSFKLLGTTFASITYLLIHMSNSNEAETMPPKHPDINSIPYSSNFSG